MDALRVWFFRRFPFDGVVGDRDRFPFSDVVGDRDRYCNEVYLVIAVCRPNKCEV